MRVLNEFDGTLQLNKKKACTWLILYLERDEIVSSVLDQQLLCCKDCECVTYTDWRVQLCGCLRYMV